MNVQPNDRPVLVQADGEFVSAVQAQPRFVSGSAWRGFTMEVLETPAAEIPPRANLVRHLVCTIDSPQPFHFFWRENGRERQKLVSAGDNLIRSQQQLVGFRWDGAARALILGIDPETMKSILRELLPETSIQFQEFYGTPDDYVHQLMRALAADLAHGSPTGPVLGESLCTAIAVHTVRQYGISPLNERGQQQSLPKDRLRKVVDYIDSRLAEDLSLFELARVAGLSPFYLGRLFKASLGTTVHQYILSQRVERAKRFLLRTNLEMGAIAKATGFHSQSHFSQTFAHGVGVTPLSFRACA